MSVMSGKEVRDRLHAACCKCKQVRERVETQRALQDAVESGPTQPPADVTPSASFTARPNPR